MQNHNHFSCCTASRHNGLGKNYVVLSFTKFFNNTKYEEFANFYSALECMSLLTIAVLSIPVKCNNNKTTCWECSLNVSIMK